MNKILCIYHGNCDDGFAAAWCVRHALGEENVEFFAGQYQQPPPDVTARDVVIVDFSYRRDVLVAMAASARSILVLDHHKTAQDDLAGFPLPDPWPDHLNNGFTPSNLRTLFDMGRSGATLAWDYFNRRRPRPDFIAYIEDRDLWRKTLPGGDEFTIALRSYPQDFATWERFIEMPGALIAEGVAIQRYYRLRVEELKRSAYRAYIPHQPGIVNPICAVVNAPYFAASEVAGEIIDLFPGVLFGACYFEVARGRWEYSLRSRNDFDVSEVAKWFGGGGHKAAAGFTADSPVHLPASSS